MLPVLRLEAGVEMLALCLPEELCTSSANTGKFLAGEIELVSGLCVARATQRDLDTLEGLRSSVYYVYLMHFVLSYLEINPGMYRKELFQHDFIARAPAACLILCNIL